METIPGSLEAIARLNQNGYRVGGGNQPVGWAGVAGWIHSTRFTARCIRHLRRWRRIDAIFYCPHAADSDQNAGKPKPGMYRRIADTLNVDLKGVPTIGDSLRDLQAGSAGCQPYLVLTGKGEKTVSDGNLPEGTQIFLDLAACVDALLK